MPYMTSMTLNIGDDLLKNLQGLAQQRGVSRETLARDGLNAWVSDQLTRQNRVSRYRQILASCPGEVREDAEVMAEVNIEVATWRQQH